MMTKKLTAWIASVLVALTLLAAPVLVFNVSAAGDPTLAVGNASADAGDTVSVDITVSDNPGVCAMILNIEYDKDSLSLDSVDESVGSVVYHDDRIVWVNMTGDTYNEGTFFTLNFSVLDSAVIGDKNISISYSDGDICNYDEDSIDFELTDGTITVLTGGTADPDAETESVSDVSEESNDLGLSVKDSDKITEGENADNGKDSPDEGRLPVIIVVVLVVLIAIGTCVFAVIKNKKSGNIK